MRKLLLFAVFLLPAVAYGEQPVRVVYAPLTALDEAGKKLVKDMDKAIVAELQERRRIAVVQRDVTSGAGQDSYVAVTSVHAAWLADAEKAYDQGNNDQAVTYLQRYLKDVSQKPQSANLSDLGRAHLLLSATQFRRGKEDEGQQSLDELVRLRPDLEVTSAAYPPLFIRLHQKAFVRWRDKSSGTIVIDAPDGSELALNGRKVPVATVLNVPPGVHYVSLSAGVKQIVRKIEVEGGEVKQVAFGATQQKGALAGNRFDRPVKRSLGSLANKQSAPFLVTAVASVMGSELVIKLLMVTSTGEGGSLGDFSVDLDLLSASVEAQKIADRIVDAIDRPPADVEIAPLLSASAVTGQSITVEYFSARPDAMASVAPRPVEEPKQDVTPKVLIVPQVEPRDARPSEYRPITAAPGETPTARVLETKQKPVYKQWWLWTIVGAVVVGGVTTGVLLGTAKVGNVSVSAQW